MKTNDEFAPAKQHATLTTGKMIRMLRDLKGWTPKQQAEESGLHEKKHPPARKRTEQLAKAFGVHPAMIMFP